MDETNALLAEIRDALMSGKNVSNDLTIHGETEGSENLTELIAAPSKLELARQWLKDNPKDKKRSTRWLEENVKPLNVPISRTYWGKAKGRK